MRQLRTYLCANQMPPRLLVFGGLVLWLSLIYMPVYQGYYLYMDDYNAWTIGATGRCDSFYAFQFGKDLGRPLLNYVNCILALPIQHISDVRTPEQ